MKSRPVAITIIIAGWVCSGCAQPPTDDQTPGSCDHDGDGYCPQATDTMPGGDCCDQPTDPGCAENVAPGQVFPGAPETCADLGVDNDCDGDAQEAENTGDTCIVNEICPNTLCLCRTGTFVCDGGALACRQTTSGATEEACNNQDDDCDDLDDYHDPDVVCPANQYCDGHSCVDGCTPTNPCTNNNFCNSQQQCECGGNQPCAGNFECNQFLGLCLCAGVECGPGETCNAQGLCQCGSGPVGNVGEACPDDSPGPDCVPADNACFCGVSICDADETCSEPGGGGRCRCGQTEPMTGEACPDPLECCDGGTPNDPLDDDCSNTVDYCGSCTNDCDGDPNNETDDKGDRCIDGLCQCGQHNDFACDGNRNDTCCVGSFPDDPTVVAECADLDNDDDHCGACFHRCPPNESCNGSGHCTPPVHQE